MVSTPNCLARSATVPVIENAGRPWSSVSTSASNQDIPEGAPSALAKASLAANLAAWEAMGRSASAGVKSRATNPGRRSTDSANRATSQTSMPTPMIIRGSGSRSVRRDGLGQIAWLINIVALLRRQLAGEHLKRHRSHQGLQQRGHFGKPDQDVRERYDFMIILLCQHHRACPAGADLLEVGDDFVVQHVASLRGYDHKNWKFVLHQGNGAVLQFAGGEAFGMDIRQFLQFQGSLEGDGIAHMPAEKKDRRLVGEIRGQRQYRFDAVQHGADRGGHGGQLAHRGRD